MRERLCLAVHSRQPHLHAVDKKVSISCTAASWTAASTSIMRLWQPTPREGTFVAAAKPEKRQLAYLNVTLRPISLVSAHPNSDLLKAEIVVEVVILAQLSGHPVQDQPGSAGTRGSVASEPVC